MEFSIFYELVKKQLLSLNIDITEFQARQLYLYMNLLLEWNKKMNLTAITQPQEIISKHFVDSLMILKYINDGDKVIDVGTGAGFPGIPLKIIKQDIQITLLDSLNKRVLFLNEVINQLKLNDINAIHFRAEEFGKIKEHREQYNVVVSRAVARLNVLVEYMLPLVKLSGRCVCMKGSNLEEFTDAEGAIKILGGEVEKIEEIILPDTDIKRNNIIIKKIKNTPKQYPRKSGIPSKTPLCR